MTHRYTREETAAINAAWQSLTYLCSCTNWSDTPALKEALKMEKAQAASDEPSPLIWARARVLKAWHEGLESPNAPVRHFYGIRSGYLLALMLGVRHAVERASDDYTGPMVAEARDLAAKAIEAHANALSRYLERA